MGGGRTELIQPTHCIQDQPDMTRGATAPAPCPGSRRAYATSRSNSGSNSRARTASPASTAAEQQPRGGAAERRGPAPIARRRGALRAAQRRARSDSRGGERSRAGCLRGRGETDGSTAGGCSGGAPLEWSVSGMLMLLVPSPREGCGAAAPRMLRGARGYLSVAATAAVAFTCWASSRASLVPSLLATTRRPSLEGRGARRPSPATLEGPTLLPHPSCSETVGRCCPRRLRTMPAPATLLPPSPQVATRCLVAGSHGKAAVVGESCSWPLSCIYS